MRIEELIFVFDELYILLDGGVGIDFALQEVIASIKDKTLKRVFEEIYKDVNAGNSLFNSFLKHKGYFGDLIITMVRVGEESGDLAESFRELSDILREILDNKLRFKKAIRYPLFLIFIMIVAFLIVIFFVIPPFKRLFLELNASLPLPTRLILWLYDFVSFYGIFLLGGLFLVNGVGFIFYKSFEFFRERVDAFVLKIYLLKDIILYSMKGRFVYLFYKLVNAGINVDLALEIAIDGVENLYLKKRLLVIKYSILNGLSLADGFKRSGVFERIVIYMIKSAEEGGKIDFALKRISEFYFKKYAYLVDNILIFLEPVLIFIIATFVLLLGFGIFLPIWNLVEIIR